MTAYQRFCRRIEEARRDYPHYSWAQAQEFCRSVYGDLHAQMLREEPKALKKLANEAIADRREKMTTLVNANMARGMSYDDAFNLVMRENVSLSNEMSGLPKGSTMSADGQHLRSGGKPSGQELMDLGLPQNASDEAVRIFRAAEQVKLTPEIAALVVRTIVQLGQMEGGLPFDAAMDHLKQARKELYAEARKARPK